MFSLKEVDDIATEILSKYIGTKVNNTEAMCIKISSKHKELHIEWPKHDLAEVWMTFLVDGNYIYQDWFECFESEDKSEFVQYIISIPKRFFNQEVRVKKHGIIFRRDVLESKTNSGWRDVFDQET